MRVIFARGAMEYVASVSGGKDSTAMTLYLIDHELPLTKAVFFDTGAEYGAVLRVIDKLERELSSHGVEFVRLYPDESFYLQMLARPVKGRMSEDHFGYEWCGGATRWMTRQKTAAVKTYMQALGECVEYVGIAADEAHRAKAGKRYPLIDAGMTEADCLAYCRDRGYSWDEDGVDLYDVLDRASCWCCGNKNLKELRNMRRYLPHYWSRLMGLQSRMERPYRKDASVFDLDRRFEMEGEQLSMIADFE